MNSYPNLPKDSAVNEVIISKNRENPLPGGDPFREYFNVEIDVDSYLAINTDRWSFKNKKEIVEFAIWLCGLMPEKEQMTSDGVLLEDLLKSVIEESNCLNKLSPTNGVFKGNNGVSTTQRKSKRDSNPDTVSLWNFGFSPKKEDADRKGHVAVFKNDKRSKYGLVNFKKVDSSTPWVRHKFAAKTWSAKNPATDPHL